MSSVGSITYWIGCLKGGNQAVAQKLWEGYFERLVRLARSRLQASPRRVADEEDVALSAFDSFCRGVEHGRFPQLADRHDLWQLLVLITVCKASDLIKYERRQKRGGNAVLDEAALAVVLKSPEGERGLEQILGPEPSPAFAAQVAEECERLLDRLGEPGLRQVALWKMEGFANEEIARRLGCALRSVERKLQLIRRMWKKDGSR
jgi:DNA-directed RNA polymerase specialized sigma24 family protein